ncbi:AsmA family protein [uncultured Bartonella sp.]|uniref:AsmA family protein n=1 Tax=uncultured Bartonella sp. TaxID=104108 RepID=UPI00260D1F4C|nr:AsmA family protein [uncultured Bartonella sp.]
MRRRAVKIVGLLALLLVIAGMAIFLLLPALVSTDAIRIRLAQDLSAWTGYNVQLREAPRLDLFPYPRASLSGVTLTPMNDESAPLMDATRIEVDLSFFDALLGHISFSQTRIINPHFVMEEPIKTVADFFDTISRSQGSFGSAVREAREIVNKNPDRPDTTRLLNQPFGRIIIENGELLYRKSLGGMAEKITALNAVLEWPESTRVASLRANARWHGEATDLRIDAMQALLLLSGGTSELRASVNSLRGGITFEGKGRLSQNYLFSGRLFARSPGWNQTMDWLGYHQVLGQGLKAPVVWESDFSAQPGHMQLDNIFFKLGNDSARGALAANYQDDIPIIAGSLAFDKLNLDTLVATFFPDEEKNEYLDLSVLDRIGLDIRMSAPEAKLDNIGLNNLAAAIQIRNGRGIFDLGNANVFGGAIQSNIQISRDNERATIEGRFSGSSLDVQSIVRSFRHPCFVDAKTGFILTMHAPFSRWSEVVSRMAGKLTLNMSSGRLNGYDINGMRKILSESPQTDIAQFDIAQSDTASTDFDRWDIDAKITDENLIINKSAMYMGNWLLLTQGKADLETENTDNKNTDNKGYLVHFDSVLQKVPRSDSICQDVACVKNSLLQPIAFSTTGKNFPFDDIHIQRSDRIEQIQQ